MKAERSCRPTSSMAGGVAVLVASLHAACVRAPEGPCTASTAPVASAMPTVGGAPPQAPVATNAPSSLPSSPNAPPSAQLPPTPPPAFAQAIATAKKSIETADYPAADRHLEAAAAASGDDPHLHFLVARYRATRFAYSGDFERAAVAVVSVIPELAKHAESPDEFWAHNGMMMIREAQGDPAAALAENDQATLAAARGTWEPKDRETLAYLKDRWHRAYLTRMLAETRAGSVRQALVRYAESALDDYRDRARQLGSNDDSIAVLEAYFAALDGRRGDALRAAKSVDPAKDDDLEDLYLVVIGLEAGGDHAAAEALRQRMRQPGGVYLARPIMLRWVDHDAKAPNDRTFTPWHPSPG
jgi:hypothetical protein